MISILTAALASKWGKYALEAIVVVALVFGAYRWAESRGRESQRVEDNHAQSTEIEASRKEASQANALVVQQANANAVAAQQRAAAAEQQFAALAGILSNLNTRSQEGHAQVNQLADSDLHADIVSKLNIRPAGDHTPGYFPQEERSIDNAITQYPIEVAKNSALTGQVAEKEKEVKAGQEIANARTDAFNSDERYIGILEKYYASLYNQNPPRKRSAKCLYLWGCGQARIVVSPPAR